MAPVKRILSGMRPTGRLHLGHYHGALKNWVALQESHQCFYFVADWHSLTTEYASPPDIKQISREMVVDWLAAGIDPARATIFIQSRVPQHAELFTLLAMLMPLSWLERVPTYKEQQQALSHKDLTTYGFLGYPLLQTSDILLYRAQGVPVGVDQVPHIEMAREVARRFNLMYGQPYMVPLPQASAEQIAEFERRYREQGDKAALQQAENYVNSLSQLAEPERDTLMAHIRGGGRQILQEPEALLTPTAKLLGIDGRKMSKSYGNSIFLREDPDSVKEKLRTMQTDPARIRRSDPGDPERCPVWPLHEIYSDAKQQAWVRQGCTTAGIGCLECKATLYPPIIKEQDEQRNRAEPYLQNPKLVDDILEEGCSCARHQAEQTLVQVRSALRLT